MAAGGAASVFIYLTAGDAGQNQLVSEYRNSKAFRHELEVYGGKLSVVSTELTDWFSSLWQGEALAFTIAAITLITALLLVFISSRISNHDHTT